jgi:hypothetical protein
VDLRAGLRLALPRQRFDRDQPGPPRRPDLLVELDDSLLHTPHDLSSVSIDLAAIHSNTFTRTTVRIERLCDVYRMLTTEATGRVTRTPV